jgi:hypothetical protein
MNSEKVFTLKPFYVLLSYVLDHKKYFPIDELKDIYIFIYGCKITISSYEINDEDLLDFEFFDEYVHMIYCDNSTKNWVMLIEENEHVDNHFSVFYKLFNDFKDRPRNC